ncbi:MAG: HlyD family efflux transporter periplasmic adaptor subunit [Candidatus Eisenbacteria bacterium]|nr:HlyD family efflux transporter periplasmic adaptor subunit [Candidatus Eisenbacteria bacterium]
MKKRRRIVMVVAAAAAVGLVLWLTVFRDDANRDELAASGTVEATEARLGFQATGRVDSITVREGDRVGVGDKLASLDRTQALAHLDQARAQVEAARSALDELERGPRPEEVAQARAARDVTEQQLTDARRNLERTTNLFEGGAVSEEQYEKAQVAFDISQSRHEQAEAQLKLVEDGPRSERIEAQRAQLRQAEAGLRVAQATIANMRVVAPIDGIVTVRHREPGETVPAGSPVLTVMNPDDRWVRIFVREDRIGAVKIGATAHIRTDTYPEREYKGEVTFIASEAEFTPKNVQTEEERVKLVYAVKVSVSGDPELDLKPGMPADVWLRLPDDDGDDDS